MSGIQTASMVCGSASAIRSSSNGRTDTPPWAPGRRTAWLNFSIKPSQAKRPGSGPAPPPQLAPVRHSMSFVATLDDRVVGHVMLSAARLDAPPRIVDVLTLSPLGVLPAFQHQGIGTRLIQHALAAADSQGVPLVFLEGAPSYYGKHGFQAAEAAGFRAPSLRYPDGAFQVVRLSAHEPWMTGTFVYSETFWALDCVGLRGEHLRAARGEA